MKYAVFSLATGIQLLVLASLIFGIVGLMAGFVPAVIVVFLACAVYWADYGRRVRRLAARIARYASRGQVLTSQFGPDAVDIVQASGHARFSYGCIRRIHAGSDVVVIEYDGLCIAYPRELFPDHTVAYLRTMVRGWFRRRPARPTTRPPARDLPPIPPLDTPTAVFVAGPETTRKLVSAYTGRPVHNLGILLAVMGPLILTTVWIAEGRTH
ncbi:hypothetical protein DFR71_2914 [Nocardia alba]|uniref:YcxB-like protein n=2 Tax=Nocardia alba TaxID=225051 RepID=A0A4R1FRP8_9NOCA|nr:hypothetical protein DFR71_2914 [Nocardia alba]